MEFQNTWQIYYWNVKWGLKIDFISKPVNKHTSQMAHSAEESKIISEEIAKLLKKGVIK